MSKDTLIHPETGETLRRDIRPFEFEYRGVKIKVDMPGWYPEGDGEALFSQEDMEIPSRALHEVKERLREKSDYFESDENISEVPA